jgi:hypothetical protein
LGLGLATLGGALGLGGGDAQAYSPYLVVPEPAKVEQSPAYRYANMTNEEAFAELDQRGVRYTREDDVPGVRAPIRLAGPLHGVTFHSSLPEEQWATTVFEILDARLALTLDDFAELLARHDIDEVVHFTMYRPNVPRPDPHAHAATPAVKRRGKPGGEEPRLEKVDDDGKKAFDAKHGSAKKPDAKKPDAKKPDAKKPDAKKPDAKKPDAKKPDAKPKVEALPETPKVDKRGDRPAKAPSAEPGGAKQKVGQAKAPTTSKPPTPKNKTTVARRDDKKAAPVTKPIAPPAPEKPAAKGRDEKPAEATPETAPQKVRNWAPPGTRHPAGLAIDVGGFRKRGGSWISVGWNFQGRLGERTCGEGARVPDSPEARELRSIVCEAFDLGIFTYVLTPNFDAPHADHLHMEIKPGVKWFLYH